ncbi:MAG: pitrilysin family protein [Armatimonadota bacterium]
MSALCLRCVQAAVAFAGAAAILIIPLPLSCAATAPNPPPVQRRTLPSGLRVIVAEQAGAKLAAVDLRVRVGSGDETPSTNGTAHFLEHLVFKGTDTRKPGEIDQAVEALGGELTAQTTRDATRFAAAFPADKWQEALAIIADMTLHPALRPADVDSEKPVILSEMAIARTEPTRSGFNALTAVAFDEKDPYRLPLMGTEANVKAMTFEALRDFCQEWYRPENMTLVVTGDVRAADVFLEAERLFPGTVPLISARGTDSQKKPESVPALSGARTTLSRAGSDNLTTVFIGFRAPSAADANAATVAGLVSLLAERADGGNGSGKLREALVTRQRLALAVTADYVAQRGESLVMISATGLRSNAAKMEAALRTELKKLSSSEFTVNDAREARLNLLAAQYPDGSVGGDASRLALADVLGISPEETDDPALYAARLSRVVTGEALTAAASQYLSPERGAVVVLQPQVTP